MIKGVMTLRKTVLTAFMAALFAVSATGYVFAQSEPSGKNPKLIIDPILGATSSLVQTPVYQKKTYYESTYENLSKLYWAMGVYKLSNNHAIDGFLRINECDLFEKYFGDDFKWTEIRDATRKMIQKDRQSYPTTFEIILPLALGRYDLKTEKFQISNYTQFQSMKKISIEMAKYKPDCGKNVTYIDGYPTTVIMLLDQPFNLTEIPVKPEIADLFIHEATIMTDRGTDFERDAYLRVLVSFNGFIGFAPGMNSVTVARMHAKIDAIEVYADPSRTKPLYIKDFAEIRRRHRSRTEDESLKDEVQKALESLTQQTEEDSLVGIGDNEDGGHKKKRNKR